MPRNDVPNKVYLEAQELPTSWYNLIPNLPNPIDPPLHPVTFEPLRTEDLMSIFPKSLIAQEMSRDTYIPIPEGVQEMYRMFRPSPLTRAYCLEKYLGTPARIYYKYEGNNPSGSHKLNSAIPQAYYNKEAGIRRLTTETGAGQWGTALAVACAFYGMECVVYMVRCSYEQKPYRRAIMQTYDATVFSSPSNNTEVGRKILEQMPETSGSLGIAISEAVEDAASREDTNYALGSVLNHVVIHQSIIGQEAMAQTAKIGETPDIIIGCCGGGSNFAGLIAPFMGEQLAGRLNARFIGVEPAACPTLTRGVYAYDYGDVAGMTPLMKQYTLGANFIPSAIHAGGLRYHGMSQVISRLYHDKLIEATAVNQTDVFKAAKIFAVQEGLLPAPESSHAICQAINEALRCKETGEEKVILFCLSGHGNFDLTSYDNYNHGRIHDAPLSDEDLALGLSRLPKIPGIQG